MADAHFTGYIYIVTNTVNGKRYIGQTTWTVEERWKQHCRDARQPSKTRVLHAAIKKYGPEAFTLQSIELPSQAALDQSECDWIMRLNTLRPNGYNLAGGGRGGRLHPETKAKISLASRGRKHTPEARRRMSVTRTGRPASQARRNGISAALKGRWFSPEWRARLSAAKKGRVGQVATDVTRAKLSAALKAKYAEPGYKERHSASMRGHAVSLEARANMSAAAKRRRNRKRAA